MLNRNPKGSDPEKGSLNGIDPSLHSWSNNGRATESSSAGLDQQLAHFVDRLLASSGAQSLRSVPETFDQTIDPQDPELAGLQHTAIQLHNTFSCAKDAPLPAGFQARIQAQLEAEWRKTMPAPLASRPAAPPRRSTFLRIGGGGSGFNFGSPFARRVAAFAVALLLIALIVIPSVPQGALPGASGLAPEVIPVVAAFLLALLVGLVHFFRRK